eukprot:TRINITY_DN15212_c0_g1_i1.p1 TRINITY_DN15212_c0_g1~~TRINITY_DN15212_c0_g1_i1.p1  ORF type:complete len:215 (+),score=58.34 TRINITY_DN15212_c0_g1_i1:481-1125(+)
MKLIGRDSKKDVFRLITVDAIDKNHLDTLIYMKEVGLLPNIGDKRFIRSAIIGRKLEMSKWIVEQVGHIPVGISTPYFVHLFGVWNSIEAIEWGFSLGLPFDPQLLFVSIVYGNVELFDYLIKKGLQWDHNANYQDLSCSFQRIKDLKRAVEYGFKPNRKTAENIAGMKGNKWKLLEYYVNRGLEWDPKECLEAAESSNNYGITRWIIGHSQVE